MSSRQIATSGAGRPERSEAGAWIAVSALAMCFAALASAMAVRQGASAEWLHFELPRVLYGATALMLVSAATMEIAHRRVAKVWLLATAALGVASLCCIYIAWRELSAQGLLLATSGSSRWPMCWRGPAVSCTAKHARRLPVRERTREFMGVVSSYQVRKDGSVTENVCTKKKRSPEHR